MVAVEPMTRADASLYTDEALESLIRPREVRQALALASDVLPQDRKLLEDGKGRAKSALETAAAVAAAYVPPQQQQQQQQVKVGYGIPGVVKGAHSTTSSTDTAPPSAIEKSSIRPTSEAQIVEQQADRGKRKSGTWQGGEGSGTE